MKHERPSGAPLTGPCFYGTVDQRRTIARWENAEWIFLHWTHIPEMIAVMLNELGDAIFIDTAGEAWKGPTFAKRRAVPLEQYSRLGDD